MIFKDYLDINENFQSSINIGLDLDDINKVNEYIPTSTGYHFLNYFLDNILQKNRDKSTMIIAPYGKGKSHAILVLLNLLMYKDYKNIDKFLEKVKTSNKELFSKIMGVKNKKYMPVIISHTYGDLNQSLLLSLNKSLHKYNLNNINLKTDYSQAIERINNWKLNYTNTYELFVAELRKEKINIEQFILDLSYYSDDALHIFKEIHKKILSGVEFNPNNTLEVVEYYQLVKEKICSDYGYSGMFIVFDEFSKFLESRDERFISNEMKIIQDLAELCNSTNDNSMYFQLVMHKPINSYNKLNENVKNSFKGIEGRVSPYYFETTLKNSFELVFDVIKKNEKYNKIKKQYLEVNNMIICQISNNPIFNLEFDTNYIKSELLDNCFPLHPITLYLLVKISEKVAQNERTIFTFLTKNTSNALPLIINTDYKYQYILAPVVFDYFIKQLIEEKDDTNIYKISSNALTALEMVQEEEHINFIKTLALILIINDKEFLPTNVSVLSNSMLISEEKCKNIISELLNRGIIIQRRGGQLQFKINMDKDLQKDINNIAHTKFAKIDIIKELNGFLQDKYVYPRIYNISNSITRFFKVEYIDENDYLNLENMNLFFEEDYMDGLILNIVRKEKNNQVEVFNHAKNINDERLIVAYPKKYNDYEKIIRKLLSIRYLLNDNEYLEDNLIKAELELLFDDLKDELNNKIYLDYSIFTKKSNYYNTYNDSELCNVKTNMSKDRILSNILNSVFERTPKINLELINKQNVKGVYKKARESVCNKLLNQTIIYENLKTSPEDTIIKCTLIKSGLLNNSANENMQFLINKIKKFFNQDKGDFKELYFVLTTRPIGIRKGIIPIYIAYVLSQYTEGIIIQYKGHDIELSGETLEKINDYPDDYNFKMDRITSSKTKYLSKLSELFDCDLYQDINKYVLLTNSIQKWYASLPTITKQMIGVDNEISQKEIKKIKKYCSLMNLNPSEFITETLPKIFCCNDFSFISQLSDLKFKLDRYVDNYIIVVKTEINQVLGFNKESNLIHSLRYWYDENHSILENKVLDSATNQLMLMISNLGKNFDDESFLINKIAFLYTNLFICDWTKNTNEFFLEQFNKINDYLKLSDSDNANQLSLIIDGKEITKSFKDDLDESSELIEGIISDALDDYGDLLSNEQKLALLVKILKKYI